MIISINGIEAFWIFTNLLASAITAYALWQAWTARKVVKRLNGHAREIAASGIVQDEVIRLYVQIVLLAIAIPGIFSDRETNILTPTLLLFLSLGPVLLINTVRGQRRRSVLIGLSEEAIEFDRRASLKRIEAQNESLAEAVAENTDLTREVRDRAGIAAREANSAAETIIAQGDDAAEDRIVVARIEVVGVDTNKKVTELREPSKIDEPRDGDAAI